MFGRYFLVLCVLVFCASPNRAEAAFPAALQSDGVVVCSASSAGGSPPDFTASDCTTTSMWNIDPQGAFIWVKGTIDLDQTRGPEGEPLALFVLGKMSSDFYLNGAHIGSNGTPGADRASEAPGLMDTVLYPPQSLFRLGEYEIVFMASSHHGFMKLRHPIHQIAIAPAADITDSILRRYWPATLTLGLFFAGTLYFGITALNGEGRTRALSFSLICVFAAAQLVTEISRGLMAYTYPLHDLRLILITAFSACFGLSVTVHVLNTFGLRQKYAVLAGVAALTLLAIFVAEGFDQKALLAMTIPMGASLIATGVWSFQRRQRAFGTFLSLIVFVGAVVAYPHFFLDVLFFYLVAALVLFLFVEQGITLLREAAQRRLEQARADRLELALDQVKERNEATIINVTSAGKLHRITTDQIVHCRSTGGYSEILLEDGRTLLHTTSLTEMAETLPSTFLRVHRAHLVNANFVRTLNREPAGTGRLIMENGTDVPVSRRIMPKVRKALR